MGYFVTDEEFWTFIPGVVFGILRLRTGSVVGPVLLHTFGNQLLDRLG